MSIINPEALTGFTIDTDANIDLLKETSITGISIIESLMSPTIEFNIEVQSYRHNGYVKDLDKYAGANLFFRAKRPILEKFGYIPDFAFNGKVFRVSERKPISDQVDSFSIIGSDETVFRNASRRMSKSWKCVPPHVIVADALKGCVGVPKLIVESASPVRTYFAENIHPYQVVAQQSDVALAGGNDPSFLHYMTTEDLVGTHRFESLYGMTRKNHIAEFAYSEQGRVAQVFENPDSILSYEFPCDFDLIADLMNGVDGSNDFNSLLLINPFNGIHSIIGGNNSQCGMGGGEGDVSFTNQGSAASEPNCEIDVERHKLKRTARLSLLDADKVALRMTVGFHPSLHVGKMIKASFPNKIYKSTDQVEVNDDYGTGYYLISALTHTFKTDGMATTTIDCLSKSVGNGQTLG